MKLFPFSWIWFLTLALFWCTNFASSLALDHIKKTQFRNLWEKDKKVRTIFNLEEKRRWSEMLWKTPYWIEQDENARIWLIVLRVSAILFMLAWASPILFVFIALFSS